MAEDTQVDMQENDIDSGDSRIYEVGYHVVPSVEEADVESHVASIRQVIEKHGGSFIAEGAPSLMKLAYPMLMRIGEKYTEYDRAYFGWLKFEAKPTIVAVLEASLSSNNSILRHLIFKTVREDTRAKMKAPTLREVKRTDTLKAATRRTAEGEVAPAPVSEEKLDKALETLGVE